MVASIYQCIERYIIFVPYLRKWLWILFELYRNFRQFSIFRYPVSAIVANISNPWCWIGSKQVINTFVQHAFIVCRFQLVSTLVVLPVNLYIDRLALPSFTPFVCDLLSNYCWTLLVLKRWVFRAMANGDIIFLEYFKNLLFQKASFFVMLKWKSNVVQFAIEV